MGVLQFLTYWLNRVVILLTVLFFVLTFMSKQASIPLSRSSLRVVHLISFSAWFGTSIWMSFIAGIVLMSAVDMDTFGRAQAKLFDAYFRFSLLCLAAAGFSGAGLVSQAPPMTLSSALEDEAAMSTTLLLIASACVLVNLVFFGPQTTITMLERQRVCKELGVDRKSSKPEVRKLSKRFGMFHGMSNLVNLVAIGCGFVHICTLAIKLRL